MSIGKGIVVSRFDRAARIWVCIATLAFQGYGAAPIEIFTRAGAVTQAAGGLTPVSGLALTQQPVVLNPDLVERGRVRIGDPLAFTLADGIGRVALVDRIVTNHMGTVSIRARVEGTTFGYVLLSTAEGRTQGTIRVPEWGVDHQIQADAGGAAYYLLAMDPELLRQDEPAPPLEAGETDPVEAAERERVAREIETLGLGPDDPARIDIMIVYTREARIAAGGQAAMDAVIAQTMEKAELVLDNTDAGITLRLVHAEEVSYTESKSSMDLDRLKDPSDGHLDVIHAWRDTYGADLVAMIVKDYPAWGQAFLLSNRDGESDMVFSVTKLEHAVTSYTFIHELGHNFGLHHHRDQFREKGPTKWSNWQENTWSAGWRWTTPSGFRGCSVMTYFWARDFADNLEHEHVPVFSTPLATQDGVPMGQADDGDNRRTLRQIKHIVAAYRPEAGMPTGVTASKGTYADRIRVFWNPMTGRSHYRLSRSADIGGAKTALTGWQTATTFDDLGVVLDTTYYYWVQSATSSSGANATGYSAYDWGWLGQLAPPTNVQATNGAFPDRIEVTWGPSLLNSWHRVYRSATPSGTKTAVSGWQTGTLFADTTVSLGQSYFYWVQSASSGDGANATGYSSSASGWRALAPPASLTASKGTEAGKVRLTWSPVAGATHYRVYRANKPTDTPLPLGTWQSTTQFDDTTGECSVTYSYWVCAAVDASGSLSSAFSERDSGYWTFKNAAPEGVAATSGTRDDGILVSWNAVPGAGYYRVYRADSATASLRPVTSSYQMSLTYLDTGATPGSVYYYAVKAASDSLGNEASALSDPRGQGWCGVPPPSNVTACQGVDPYTVRVFWDRVPDAEHYQVSRSIGEHGAKTPLTAWLTDSMYIDSTPLFGTQYHYWVRATTNPGATRHSPYSAPATGWTGLRAPQSINATMGYYADRVAISWDATAEATHYQVSRSIDKEGSDRSVLSGWMAETQYDDTSAVWDNYYYYWVQAATGPNGENASPMGRSGDIAWICLAAPTGLAATQGTHSDRVQLTWNSVPNATHYRVSRFDDGGGWTDLGTAWQTGLSFNDTTAVAGVNYEYRVRASGFSDGWQPSEFSSSAIGWRSLISLGAALDAPSRTWSTGGNASWFGQDSVSHDGIASAQSGAITHNQSSWMETTVTGPGRVTFWWKVSSELGWDRIFFYVGGSLAGIMSGEQDWEEQTRLVDAGSHTLRWSYEKDGGVSAGSDCAWVDRFVWTPAPTAPENVAAGNGQHTDRIVITWDPASGASHYRVSRSDTLAGPKTPLGSGWQTDTSFTDFSTIPGVFHYYWVQAAMSQGGHHASEYSIQPVKGYRDLEGPQSVSAGDGEFLDRIRLVWNSVYGATHYQVYRADSLNGTRTPVGSPVAVPTYDDLAVAPGQVYYYWVRAMAQSAEGSNTGRFGAYDWGSSGLALADALDTPGWTWTTGGDALWAGQTAVTQDGVDAAQHGLIGHNSRVWMETVVTGPGYVTFWWKVSCETGGDGLIFSIDGTFQAWITGEQEWRRETLFVGAGSRTLRWAYSKDATWSFGADRGWVDQLSFVSRLPPPEMVTASKGHHNDRVAISWVAVDGAARYRVLRAETAESPLIAICDWIPFTTFSDTAAEAGATYHYRVQAAVHANGDQPSEVSDSDHGWRDYPPMPDFIVESIVLTPDIVAQGDVVTATVTLRNQGDQGGNSGWLDVFFNQPQSVTAGENGDWMEFSGLIGSKEKRIIEHSFVAESVGVKSYRAFVDSQGDTAEHDAGNNQGVAAYSVVLPFGNGFYRLVGDAPCAILELKPDGMLVWQVSAPGTRVRVQAASTLLNGGDWTDIHDIPASEAVMERRVFLPAGL